MSLGKKPSFSNKNGCKYLFPQRTCVRGCKVGRPEKTGILENPCGRKEMCRELQQHLLAAAGCWESSGKAVKQI